MAQVVQRLNDDTLTEVFVGRTGALRWHIVTGQRLSFATRRGWNETLMRLPNSATGETDPRLVRIALRSAAFDPDFPFIHGTLDAQLSALSLRLVGLNSDGTLRVALDNGSWVEFSSP